jgi:hypothetical protein
MVLLKGLFVFREKHGMNRKDFLDCMMELRNKGKNTTGTVSPENGQKGSPEFSKLFMPDSDVTAVQRSFRFLRAVPFRHLLDTLEDAPTARHFRHVSCIIGICRFSFRESQILVTSNVNRQGRWAVPVLSKRS